MPVAYGIGGVINVPQEAVEGSGAPPASFKGELGQIYIDRIAANGSDSTAIYIYDGNSWVQNQITLSTDATFAAASDSTASSSLAIKTYVDNIAIAGAPIAEEAVYGIGEIATDAEAVSGTANNPGVTALLLTPSNLSPVFASPPALGGTAPAGGAFTTLSASGAFSLTGDQVQVAEGGTGATTLTDHGILLGSGTAAVSATAVGTTGQILIGQTGADPVFATLASADGTITYTTGAGTLDLAVTPATESQVGGLEIATDAEAVAVTATDKIIVPSNLAAVFAAPPAIGTTTPAAAEFTTVTIADINADYTDHGVLLGQGTDTNIVATAAGTDGQLFVGATGADPAFATATSTNSSIAFTLGANTINFDIDESYMQTSSVTIATGDVLTLATTPVELVAAPGAGQYIEFLGASLILDYNSVPYTEAGDNLAIKYTNASGVQVSENIEMTGFIDQTADTITSSVPINDAIVAASAAVNQSLVLDNIGSNFGAGNSPLIVKVRYRVITSGL